MVVTNRRAPKPAERRIADAAIPKNITVTFKVNGLALADLKRMMLKKNAPIIARAIEVFGSNDVATLWMSQPNPALRMKTPIQAIASTKGRGEVKRILGRIENGVIS